MRDRPSPLLSRLLVCLSFLVYLLHLGKCSPIPKLYLTPNESTLLFPQLYIDQSIYTEYRIQGSTLAIHPSLEIVKEYTQELRIGANSRAEVLMDMLTTMEGITYVGYVKDDGAVVYGMVTPDGVEELQVVPMKTGVELKGVELARQGQLLLWGSSTFIEFTFIEGTASEGHSYQVRQVDMPLSLPLPLSHCHSSPPNFLCCTAEHTVLLSPSLSIQHILSPPPELHCIINSYLLQPSIIALCDCRQGCFNYKVQDSRLQIVTHLEMLGQEQILVMQETETAAKAVTMVVASRSILALLRWSADSIEVVDSMLLPEVEDGELVGVGMVANNIALKYRLQSISGNWNSDSDTDDMSKTKVEFQHIFINYDSVRLQYDAINCILHGPFVHSQFSTLLQFYPLESHYRLLLRTNNPYYLHVEYQSKIRNITIIAVEVIDQSRKKGREGKEGREEGGKWRQQESINIAVVPAILNEIYVQDELVREVEMNYQYSYPMELYRIFTGQISGFVFEQRQIPLVNITPQSQYQPIRSQPMQSYRQSSTTIMQYQDRKILSIYNLLQCIRLQNLGGYAFRRYLRTPTSKIYIQECKSQKIQNSGDFICQIRTMLNELTVPAGLDQAAGLFGLDAGRGPWLLFDIGYSTRGMLTYELWYRRLEQVQGRLMGLDLYEFLLKTQSESLYFIARLQSLAILRSRFLITAASAAGRLVVSVYDLVKQRVTQQVKIPIPCQAQQPFQDDRISSVQSELRHQNTGNQQHLITVGYHPDPTSTIAVLLSLHLSLQPDAQDYHPTLSLMALHALPMYSSYLRSYSHYLFSLNGTHLAKYSLLAVTPMLMFELELEQQIQPAQGEMQVQRIRNVGQFMLLVYAGRYQIIDLNGAMVQLLVDNTLAGPTVYDMIEFTSGILLVGIGSGVRLYDRNLLLNIGPYPIQPGTIRSLHLLTLRALPLTPRAATLEQSFHLTISYETSLIETRGRALKLLTNLPYSARDAVVFINETMFTGPIKEYYIGDVDEVLLLNHIEDVDLVAHPRRDQHDQPGQKPQQYSRSVLEKWLTKQTVTIIKKCKYDLLQPRQAPSSAATLLLYSNTSHILFVSLESGQVSNTVALNTPAQPQEYYQLQPGSASEYLVVGAQGVIKIGPQQEVLQCEVDWRIEQSAVSGDYLVMVLGPTAGGQAVAGKLGYMRVGMDTCEVEVLEMQGDVRTVAGVTDWMFYALIGDSSSPSSAEDVERNDKHLLCYQKASLLPSLSSSCQPLPQLIPPYYYMSSTFGYHRLVPLLHNDTLEEVTFLLLSTNSRNYHMEMKFRYGAGLGAWELSNCYVSLARYELVGFVGVYAHGDNKNSDENDQIGRISEGYDYFVLGYAMVENSNQSEDTRSSTKQDGRKELEYITGFYRRNQYFPQYCGETSSWIDTPHSSTASALVPRPDPDFLPLPRQSLLFTTESVHHLLSDLTLVLNYASPPLNSYTVINARNPDFQNKFYSKLQYQPDPREQYLWLWCAGGFTMVGLLLLGLRLLSALIDRGVIRWSRSVSEDEDMGHSPGVTVYFSNGDDGMITEESSAYRSLGQ